MYIWYWLGNTEDSDACCHLESKVEVKGFEQMTNVRSKMILCFKGKKKQTTFSIEEWPNMECRNDTLLQGKYKLHFVWNSDQRWNAEMGLNIYLIESIYFTILMKKLVHLQRNMHSSVYRRLAVLVSPTQSSLWSQPLPFLPSCLVLVDVPISFKFRCESVGPF